MLGAGELVLEDLHRPVAALQIARPGLVGPAHQLLRAATVLDEVGDRPELEVVALREGDQLRQAGHRPVLVHHLADDARGVEAGETGDVHGRLGMAGAHQRPAIAGGDGEDMAGRRDLLPRVLGIDGDRDRAGPVLMP
jgi:hypothetical protein